MYVVDVVTLSPTSPAAPLSYRSRDRIEPGTIAVVPLRGKSVHGIVVSITEVRDAKALLKSATFALAKSVTRTEGVFPASLFKTAERVAMANAVPLGSALHALFSDPLAGDLPRVLAQGAGFQQEAYELPREVRVKKYRLRIEENRKDKKATLLVAPTNAELALLKEELLAHNPIVLSGTVKAADRKALLNEAIESISLVITTPSYAFAAMHSLGEIIVERPSAGSYRMPRRPYLNRVAALIELARAREVRITLGDYPVPIDLRDSPRAAVAHKPRGRAQAIDLREKIQGEVWSAVPQAFLKEMEPLIEARKRILVLAARKGYAPSVACRDCGTTVKDERGVTYTLATMDGKRVLRSADGRSVTDAKMLCAHCGSWNLMPLGVGVERVHEELTNAFPKEQVLRFDADTVTTDAAARRMMKAFKDDRGILVATEAALPWLEYARGDDPLPLAVIASMDSLLALPFWRARERFVRIGLMLRSVAERTLLGTRLPDDAALDAVLEPESTRFFAEEAQLRKALGYPPYGALIAVSCEGSRKRLLEAKIAILAAVLPHVPIVLPERLVKPNVYRLTVLLTLSRESWPEEALSAKLQALPLFMKVVVDPESFW